jgi:hypothetical protein
LEHLTEAANMLIDQEKSTNMTGTWDLARAKPEQRHRIKMNKAEIRELIAPGPVYPGVEWLYTHPRERA